MSKAYNGLQSVMGPTFTPTNPMFGQWAANALGLNGPTWANRQVTPQTAMQLSAVWACVKLLSQTIGGLPFNIVQYDDDGHANPLPNHPVQQLLSSPFAGMNALTYWTCVIGHLATWGNHFSRIVLNSRGYPIALKIMLPDRVRVQSDSDGNVKYIYQFGKTTETLTPDQVFHVRGFSLDGFMGIGPIGVARQSLASALATDEAAGKAFANGLRPSAFLTRDKFLPDIHRTRLESTIRDFSGPENVGKTMMLEGGWTLQQLSLPPDDMQMLETRMFNVEEICRWWQVPPWVVGHMQKTTAWGTGMDSQMQSLISITFKPYILAVEQSVRNQLLNSRDRATKVSCLCDSDQLIRLDATAKAAFFASMAQNGIRTRQEMRKADGLPAIPGADVLTVQSNLVLLDKLGETPPSAPPANPDAEQSDNNVKALLAGFRDSILQHVSAMLEESGK